MFFTQIVPANLHNFNSPCRSSLFRCYPHPITVPIRPTIRLFDQELQNVKDFVARNLITTHDVVVLFECSSTSGQSFINSEFAIQIAQTVVQNNSRIKFILSSDKSISQQLPNIIDGSSLTFRENAELTHYCDLIIGCSSGISWLATSDWAKPIPQIQLLNKSTGMFASMLNDARYFHLSTDHILEIIDATTEHVSKIVLSSIERSFDEARKRYQNEIPISFDFYFTQLDYELFSKNMHLKAAQAIGTAFQRYTYAKNGVEELQQTIKTILTPYVKAHWNKLSEEEKISFIKIGVNGSVRNIIIIWCISLLQLLIYSFFGSRTRSARHLLITTIRHLFEILKHHNQ